MVKLYRGGNTSSGRFDNVRPQDITQDANGNVHPNTGGISTFNRRDKLTNSRDDQVWVIESTSFAPGALRARNDAGAHYSIEPAKTMSLTTYKGHLTRLNAAAVRYDRQSAAVIDEITRAEADAPAPPLKDQSTHHDRAVRFVYNALADIVRKRVPITGWDDNDYAYVHVLAEALEAGELPLSALVWDSDANGEWSNAKAFAVEAVSAHMEQEKAQATMSAEEDACADADNDHAYLREIFRLHEKENPFAKN